MGNQDSTAVEAQIIDNVRFTGLLDAEGLMTGVLMPEMCGERL